MDIMLCPVTEKYTDLLDRQEYVDKMLNVAEILSNNKKNSCYAINGAWGVGKTFVLNMFEEQATILGKEGETLPRYLIFRYNCWEYDYYDEPVIAIVASILDQIDDKETVIPQNVKDKIVGVLKILATELFGKVLQIAEAKTSLPLEKVAKIIEAGFSQSAESISEANEYDHYFEFKTILNQLQDTISALAKEQTLIFIVDELDRCLPNYTIKVLERLHHLFYGIPNVQVILAIDKGQLEHVVKQIYGHDTDVNKYLAKFINFELKLNEGEFNEQINFETRFKEYTTQFEIPEREAKEQIAPGFIRTVFNGIDIRNRIAILDKCLLLHNMLYPDGEKMDIAVMCIEVLLAVINYVGVDTQKSADYFSIDHIFRMPATGTGTQEKPLKEGLQQIAEIYSKADDTEKVYYKEDRHNNYIFADDIWGILLSAYRLVIGYKKDQHLYSSRKTQQIIDTATDFWALLQTVS